MQALCKDGTMSIAEWVDAASQLPIDGLEWYAGFLEMKERANWEPIRRKVEEKGLTIPMMCCSPDFTHPDPEFRAEQIEREKFWIDMTAALGGGFCRVLSGQRRPELSRDEGIRLASQCIEQCAPYAAERGVTLVIENH
jgi:sugar phosphate isomerase/epimerase